MTEPDAPGRPIAKVTTPLLVIASFVSLTEALAALSLTKSVGTIQLILTLFVVIFPIGVAAAFFAILWNRNYVLYPPTEYGASTDVERYVDAMRPGSGSSLGIPIAQTVEANQTVVATVAMESQRVIAEIAEPKEEWSALFAKKDFGRAATRLLEQAAAEGIEPGLAHALAGRMTLDKDRTEGLAFFERTFATLPTEAEPYIWLGNAYSAWDQLSEALETADRGIAAGAERMPLILAKARYLATKGRATEAIDMLDAEFASSTDVRALIAVAELHSSAGLVDRAAASYELALQEDPVNEQALLGLATLRMKASDRIGALPLYHRLIAANPNSAQYQTLLGNAYLELDLHGKALNAYEKANKLAEGKEGWILANIGNLMKNRGFSHKAVEYLEQALALEPRSAYAMERLASALKAVDVEDETEAKLLRPVNEQETRKLILP